MLEPLHINYVANGMGGQSMKLLDMAGRREIPATVSITADTGWEQDCDLNTGEKITARDFFYNFLEPFAKERGIKAYFVRSVDKYKNPLPSIPEYLAAREKANSVPMYGSRGGQMLQSCTSKWKLAAMKQQLRRLGATTARSAQGIHWDEAARRVKGTFIGLENGHSIYRDETKNKRSGKITTVKWLTHYYPLVDLRMGRQAIKVELEKLKIPYLVSSECDGCPHQDYWRWSRHTEESIAETAALEANYKGEFFFTDRIIPLREAILKMKTDAEMKRSLFDTDIDNCDSGLCFT